MFVTANIHSVVYCSGVRQVGPLKIAPLIIALALLANNELGSLVTNTQAYFYKVSMKEKKVLLD